MTDTSGRRSAVSDRLGLAVLILVIAFLAWRLLRVSGVSPMIPVNTPLPPLAAEGWLNLAEGESFDPMGELVVVDCWATWCGPCLRDLPNMAEIAADYRPRGVMFVSITQEPTADLPAIKGVVERTPGFDWPAAYGGNEFMDALGVRGFPTVVLFGRGGRARWSGPGSYGLRAALDEALADEPAPAAARPAT
jgi:thiol-disulfide isomerase/thioredoxin